MLLFPARSPRHPLSQAGTLRPGDIVRAGASYGKVRSLTNDLGRPLVDAGPSIAVQVRACVRVCLCEREREKRRGTVRACVLECAAYKQGNMQGGVCHGNCIGGYLKMATLRFAMQGAVRAGLCIAPPPPHTMSTRARTGSLPPPPSSHRRPNRA